MVAVLPVVPADGRSVTLMVLPALLYAASALLAAVVRARSGPEAERTRGHRACPDGTTTDRAAAHGSTAD